MCKSIGGGEWWKGGKSNCDIYKPFSVHSKRFFGWHSHDFIQGLGKSYD